MLSHIIHFFIIYYFTQEPALQPPCVDNSHMQRNRMVRPKVSHFINVEAVLKEKIDWTVATDFRDIQEIP